MDVVKFWVIGGGAAWLVVAIAIFGRVITRNGSRSLNRQAGGRCLLGALLGIGLLAVILGVVNATLKDAPDPLRNAILLVTHAGMAAFLLLFAAHVEPGHEILGFAAPRAIDDLGRGIGVYVAFIPVVVAAHVLNSYFVGERAEQVQKTVHDALTQHGPGRVVLILNLVLLVPLFEEVVFRGLLQQGIKSQLAVVIPGPRARMLAVVLASIIFTTLHDPPTYLPVFVLSLLLGSAYEKSGRILVPVGLHATHNLAVVLYESFGRQFGAAA